MHGASDRGVLILQYVSVSTQVLSEKDPEKLSRLLERKKVIEEGLGMTPEQILKEASPLIIPGG